MSLRVPRGFQLAGVHCGIKHDRQKLDLTLVVCPTPAVAAGVYTQNLIRAAPVDLDRQRTPSDRIRAVVANSGNANACTGPQGLADAHQMARLAAEACGARADQVLVLSTGVIGTCLPIEKIARGIRTAHARLGDDAEALAAAARGIMTTDSVPKIAGQTLSLPGRQVQITGIAKGAGMIAPHMATMLAILLADAPLTPAAAQKTLAACVDQTFNAISVDGHTSTNDSVLLLANGAAGGATLDGAELASFQEALGIVCRQLARAIPSDGEGATHLITIEVAGCASREAADRIARTIAASPLVKTAIAGGDPNWGRIVSAAGFAGVPFNPQTVRLRLNGTLLYDAGRPVPFDPKKVSDSIRGRHETQIQLDFAEGTARAHHWTSDLTADYVRFNADYHT